MQPQIAALQTAALKLSKRLSWATTEARRTLLLARLIAVTTEIETLASR
jgi:hypothetical protein